MSSTKKKVETKTYCIRDYHNRHCWASIGVFARENTGTIFQVFKCSQCGKIILEKLEEITRVYQ
ncbi:MAG: hypothetical protein U9R08_03625 [Nanoarchaeota archaeon]|nr:hypothetical protein [Nanoarchaeota archaeon]